MGVASYVAFRQVEALSESVYWTLGAAGVPGAEQNDQSEVIEWIKGQGLTPPEMNEDVAASIPKAGIISASMSGAFREKVGRVLGSIAPSSASPDPELAHHGARRAGAGWECPDNFIITSAFVRLLGALEQFERDVLKCLFHYRPSGRCSSRARLLAVDPEIMFEEPQKRPGKKQVSVYANTPVWTWLRKAAEKNFERGEIFERVFGITSMPPAYKSVQKNAWYEKRNKIAHGSAEVLMSLSEYVDVEAFVANSILHIADQCQEKVRLIV